MTLAPPPPSLDSLRAGTTLIAGCGVATVLEDLDFETYCEAGFVWNEAEQKWDGPPNAAQNKKGLPVVGAAVYAQHPSLEVLSLAYDLKDGGGRQYWRPVMPPPGPLLAHIAAGGLLEAHNSSFEHWVWNTHCVPRYGWPALPLRQLRCSMAKARAHALPGALDKLGDVLRLSIRKDADGKRLLDKFSVPRKPTKSDPRRRIRPSEDPTDAARLYSYNGTDIASEAEASSRVPDLPPDELEFWLCDQEINYRGVAIDAKGVADCIVIVQQAFALYNAELHALTGGAVEQASQLERLKGWLTGRSVYLSSATEDAIDEALLRKDLDSVARRALEIRQLIGSASIKKLFTMRNQMAHGNRLHDLFSYHAARTGRATGNGPQPQNLPKAGPDLFGPSNRPGAFKCCGRYFGAHTHVCPWCGAVWPPEKPQEWTAAAVEDALLVIATGSLDCVEMFFGSACVLVIGVLRAMFVAADGHDLIASDYNSIEAVALAVGAGEEWRLEVFRTHGKIYETGASRITGIPFEEFARYYAETGKHLPERAKIGKISELASGYQGWIGAWRQFGADEYFSDDEIKKHILAWRAASPAIVELWGGQHRGRPWDREYRAEYYGLEGMAIQAVLNPGTEYTYKAPHPIAPAITYFTRGDALYCRLPSGRLLTYHNPRLRPSERNSDEYALSFMGWNTNPKMGSVGWVRMDTYGGKLVENWVQAVSRDILRDAIVRLRRAGYPVVLHVHDEIVAEILHAFGSIEEFERIMMAHEEWARGWPIRASGGWRGRRYRK